MTKRIWLIESGCYQIPEEDFPDDYRIYHGQYAGSVFWEGWELL